MKFIPAPSYLFCLALPGSCLTRYAKLKSHLCTYFELILLAWGLSVISPLGVAKLYGHVVGDLLCIFRRASDIKSLYEEFQSSRELHLLTPQQQNIILEYLKSLFCHFKALSINDISDIPGECLSYKSSVVYQNYSEQIPCIGNKPGFLMTKMPFWERE